MCGEGENTKLTYTNISTCRGKETFKQNRFQRTDLRLHSMFQNFDMCRSIILSLVYVLHFEILAAVKYE